MKVHKPWKHKGDICPRDGEGTRREGFWEDRTPTWGWLTEEERCKKGDQLEGHSVGKGTGAGSTLEHVGWAQSSCVARTVGGRALKVGPALTSVDPGSCLTILKGPSAKLGDPNFYPSSTTNWLCDTRMGRCAGLTDL